MITRIVTALILRLVAFHFCAKWGLRVKLIFQRSPILRETVVGGWYSYESSTACVGILCSPERALEVLLHELWHAVQHQVQGHPESLDAAMMYAFHWPFNPNDLDAAVALANNPLYDDEERGTEFEAELMALDYKRYTYAWVAWILRQL